MNINKFSLFLRPATIRKLHTSGLKIKTCCKSIISTKTQTSVIKRDQINSFSTYEVKNVAKEDNLLKKMVKKIPFLNFDEMKIKARGYILYEEIADKIDYFEVFNELDLADTFYSWFIVTELYIWMLSLRVMAEGYDGKILRNAIIEALWIDVAQRVKKLGSGSPSTLRAQVLELSEQMQASFIAYDEGIQSDDTVLAGAIWRRFYINEEIDVHKLEKIVKYIRKQVSILDTLSSDVLFKENPLQWESFKSS